MGEIAPLLPSWLGHVYHVFMDLLSIWQGNELHSQGRFNDALQKYLLVSGPCVCFNLLFIHLYIHLFLLLVKEMVLLLGVV
jgi:hypothetical protein